MSSPCGAEIQVDLPRGIIVAEDALTPLRKSVRQRDKEIMRSSWVRGDTVNEVISSTKSVWNIGGARFNKMNSSNWSVSFIHFC